MGLTCLTCGNSGFTSAFVHCVRCLEFVVHRYCLNVIPETFDEYVHWLCDDCDFKVRHKKREAPCLTTHITAFENGKGLTAVDHVHSVELSNKCSTEENTHFEASENDKGLTVVDNVDSVELSNKCSSQENTHFNASENGKELTVVDHVDSAELQNKCSSQDNVTEKIKDIQSQHTDLLDKRNAKEKKRLSTESTIEEEQKKYCSNSSKQLRKECASTDTLKQAKLASDSVLPKEKEEKKVFEQRGERSLSEQPCELNTEPGTGNQIKEEGITASAERFDKQGYEMDGEARMVSATNNQQLFAKDPTILPILDPNVRNEPQITPVWRGSFEILNPNQHILEGLMAHLACKACEKAYAVACQFQTLLQLEMLPKFDVWPRSFQSSPPNDDNIALYFFPSTTSASERVFDQLVNKMMEKELALRGSLQNAELLLFPSTELPMLYWRFQGKYYLWGVFKGKQRAPSQTNPSNREPECKTAKNETKRGNERSPLSTLTNNVSPAVAS